MALRLGVSRRSIQNYESGGIIPKSKSALLRSFVEGNIEGNQINVGNNAGNIAGGNLVQITLPESGTQKIIKPDGTVTIEPMTLNNSEKQCNNNSSECDSNIQELMDTIDLQKQLIRSLQENIEFLKGLVNKK